MSLSTLRAPISRASLTSLTNDSLLVILGYLSVPQLLTFLSLSRRLNSLIVQYILPAYRTIHLPNLAAKVPAVNYFNVKKYLFETSIFFSRRCYYPSTSFFPMAFFCDESKTAEPSHFLSVPLCKSQLGSFPLELPRLLWRLQSLTFSYFLDDNCRLSEEEKLVNRCLTVFLKSSWSQTLVSLNLYIDCRQGSQADENTCLFGQLNHFPSLKHLFLYFNENGCRDTNRLPDSFPVLSQLHSFSLHWYSGSNRFTLLRQLGPHLVFLSLFYSGYLFQDVLRIICDKPSYGESLTTLQFNKFPVDSSYWSNLTSTFPALINLYGPFSVNRESFFAFFTLLGRLSQLRELRDFSLPIKDLRALRDATYPRLHRLPTLPSIRRLSLFIKLSKKEEIALQTSELFDVHLPLLGGIFWAAEKVEIRLELPSTTRPSLPRESAPLSRQLAEKVKQHFPSVRTCEAYGSSFVWVN